MRDSSELCPSSIPFSWDIRWDRSGGAGARMPAGAAQRGGRNRRVRCGSGSRVRAAGRHGEGESDGSNSGRSTRQMRGGCSPLPEAVTGTTGRPGTPSPTNLEDAGSCNGPLGVLAAVCSITGSVARREMQLCASCCSAHSPQGAEVSNGELFPEEE